MKLSHKILFISIFFAALFGAFFLKFSKLFDKNILIGAPLMYAKIDIKYVNIDENGFITDIVDEEKEKLVELRSKDFKNIFVGKKISISDDSLFPAISMIANEFNKSGTNLDYIEIYDENNIKLGKDKIIIEFGDIHNIAVKIKRAIEIYPEIKDLSGTLDLRDCRNNMTDEKYIFKKS